MVKVNFKSSEAQLVTDANGKKKLQYIPGGEQKSWVRENLSSLWTWFKGLFTTIEETPNAQEWHVVQLKKKNRSKQVNSQVAKTVNSVAPQISEPVEAKMVEVDLSIDGETVRAGTILVTPEDLREKNQNKMSYTTAKVVVQGLMAHLENHREKDDQNESDAIRECMHLVYPAPEYIENTSLQAMINSASKSDDLDQLEQNVKANFEKIREEFRKQVYENLQARSQVTKETEGARPLGELTKKAWKGLQKIYNPEEYNRLEAKENQTNFELAFGENAFESLNTSLEA